MTTSPIPIPEATFYAVFKVDGVPGGIDTCCQLIVEYVTESRPVMRSRVD